MKVLGDNMKTIIKPQCVDRIPKVGGRVPEGGFPMYLVYIPCAG